MGTFKLTSSRSYTMLSEAGDSLLVRHANRPSTSSTPPTTARGRDKRILSYSAPPTPSMSHATLSLPQDLSDTGFSDIVATQRSVDPVLSAGPDFIASAGFSPTAQSTPQANVPPTQQSFDLRPQESFDAISFLDRQASGAEALFDDQDDDEMGGVPLDDMLNLEDWIKISESSSDDDKDSNASSSSPVSNTFAVGALSPSAENTHQNSPSPASSNHSIDLFTGVDVAGWRNSANRRPQPRHPPKRSPHGLSLSGNALRGSRHSSQPSSNLAKKRKISEVHGKKSPPMPSNKRRVSAGTR